MLKKSYFVNESEIRKYNIQNIEVNIEVTPHVFPPPKNNPITSEYMKINGGESVIDIGTGSGILAILAAKLGGIVSATDNDKYALELSKKNARENNVTISFALGDYFASFHNKFDVIIGNLSQTILPPNYNKMPQLYRFVDGGKEGNTHIIELLKRAKKHMHKSSRLYVNIFTISDYQKTIELMNNLYNVKILAKQSEPVKEFVENNIDFYRSLEKTGKIKIYFDESENTWMAEQIFCELTLNN
ncbi:MAG: 50S ribosomal protein L11 methyltransferase [Candidatus Pacearchaeota archaeon]|nr:50S ribosomal protein L11 methyltransferase [Candidatus Pacearchaeota archaeon]